MQLTSLNDIQKHHRHIFLAPHYDDVVFSCGGTLAVQVSCGIRPLVITIFGGLKNSQSISSLGKNIYHAINADPRTDTQKVIATRQQEDAAALDYLECDYLWLDYPDAIYRGNPPYYPTLTETIGGDVHQDDIALERELAEILLDLRQRFPDAAFYAPLAISRHVDHQLVCSAADHLVQDGAKVYFYEDVPYVFTQHALENRLQELGGTLEFTLVEMSEMLPARLEASALYATQISSNFQTAEQMQRQISEYAHSIRPVQTVHLERFWIQRS